MKKLAAAVMTAVAMAAAPIAMAMAPTAQADVCGDVGGRHVDVGGCTDIARDAVVGTAVAGAYAAPEDAAAQMANGQPPCYTAEGVPYYTPGSDPCLP